MLFTIVTAAEEIIIVVIIACSKGRESLINIQFDSNFVFYLTQNLSQCSCCIHTSAYQLYANLPSQTIVPFLGHDMCENCPALHLTERSVPSSVRFFFGIHSGPVKMCHLSTVQPTMMCWVMSICHRTCPTLVYFLLNPWRVDCFGLKIQIYCDLNISST